MVTMAMVLAVPQLLVHTPVAKEKSIIPDVRHVKLLPRVPLRLLHASAGACHAPFGRRADHCNFIAVMIAECFSTR